MIKETAYGDCFVHQHYDPNTSQVESWNTTTLYYDEEDNKVINWRGDPVYDIFNYVHPRVFALFKLTKSSMLIQSTWGTNLELIWPDECPFD